MSFAEYFPRLIFDSVARQFGDVQRSRCGGQNAAAKNGGLERRRSSLIKQANHIIWSRRPMK
jgi:hypothetical protein